MLAVLSEERAERGQVRAALDSAQLVHHQQLEEQRAAHEAAREALERAKAAEIAAETRRAASKLEDAIAAFCERWVPPGADQEKYQILRQIGELAAVR
eukprot:7349716-Prymnesium_polylepis.1